MVIEKKRLFKNLVRMDSFYTWKPREVGNVKCHNAGDAVGSHDCCKASVMNVNADNSVIDYQFPPQLKRLNGIRKNAEEPFELGCIEIRTRDAKTYSIYIHGARAYVPKFRDVLRRQQ